MFRFNYTFIYKYIYNLHIYEKNNHFIIPCLKSGNKHKNFSTMPGTQYKAFNKLAIPIHEQCMALYLQTAILKREGSANQKEN